MERMECAGVHSAGRRAQRATRLRAAEAPVIRHGGEHLVARRGGAGGGAVRRRFAQEQRHAVQRVVRVKRDAQHLLD